ncbi:MAG: hypothetical protein ACYSUM_21410 [Planctomycetota bacterium]
MSDFFAPLRLLGGRRVPEFLPRKHNRYELPEGFRLPPQFIDIKKARFFNLLAVGYVQMIVTAVQFGQDDLLEFDELELQKMFESQFEKNPRNCSENARFIKEMFSPPDGLVYLVSLILSAKKREDMDSRGLYLNVMIQVIRAGTEAEKKDRKGTLADSKHAGKADEPVGGKKN